MAQARISEGSGRVTARLLDAAGLAALQAPLAELARAAADPNIFFEPAFLLPALTRLGAPAGFRALLVADAAEPARLLGLFPWVRTRLTGIGPPVLTSYVFPQAPHGYLATPLLRRGAEAAAVDGLLDALDAGRLGTSLLELREVAVATAFDAMLRQRLTARAQPRLDLGRRDRALFLPGAGAEAYLGAVQSGSRRRKHAQLLRQLERQGAVGFRRLRPEDDPAPWIEAFLALELAGWKGKEGTALASSPAGAAFLREAATRLHGDGRLLMYGMWLDERPIALHLAFLAAGDPGEAFAFKIAYDEAFARQSPGIQLELWAIAELHGPEPFARRIDSCAGSNQTLWRELWRDRMELGHLLIARRGWRGSALLRALDLGRGLRQRIAARRQASLAAG